MNHDALALAKWVAHNPLQGGAIRLLKVSDVADERFHVTILPSGLRCRHAIEWAGQAADLAFAALEQALVERECFLVWFPFRRSHIELMSLESDPRWPVFIEKVTAAVQAGASATS